MTDDPDRLLMTELELQPSSGPDTMMILSSLNLTYPMRLRHVWLYDTGWHTCWIRIGLELPKQLDGAWDLRPLYLPAVPRNVLVELKIESERPQVFTGGKIIAEVIR